MSNGASKTRGDSQISATMYIECKVRVRVGTWNGASSFQELHETAKHEGIQKLRNKLIKSGDRDCEVLEGSESVSAITFTPESSK